MGKDKDLKKLLKSSVDDKLKNTIMMLIYLRKTMGPNGVREYYGKAIPEYLLVYEGLGGGKRMMIKAWKKTNPSGYMKKITEGLIEDLSFLVPPENYEIQVDTKKELRTKVNCDFIRALEKSGKKFKVDFDVRDCYCNEACTPMLTKVFEDLYLQLEVELMKEGCIRKVMISENSP